MKRRIFNEDQIKILMKNPNVSKCSKKSITYSGAFKIKAVEQHSRQFVTAKEIFVQAGFDLKIIGQDTPKYCLKRWRKTYKTKGLGKLSEDSRGRLRRPRTKKSTDNDKIKRLEAEVAYLKAENDFLAKLRAKRAE